MTRQDLVDGGHENPDFDGCIIGMTTDERAVYSLKWCSGSLERMNARRTRL